MKRSRTILVIAGVILATTLSVTQSVPTSEIKDFFTTRTSEQTNNLEKESNLTLVSSSLELLIKSLPYLNSK